MKGNSMKRFSFILISLCLILPLAAEDWPSYRGDNSRSAYRTEALPEKLDLIWSHQSSTPPKTAWLYNHKEYSYNFTRTVFDKAYNPVVSEGVIYYGSVNGKVIAVDLLTGKELWKYFTAGPVRLAPTVWNDTLFVNCDDGFLYALSKKTGSFKWKHQGAPTAKLLLGNNNMISKWPARGGAVVENGIVYYGAGIWPTEGFYLYALEADTGKLIWLNDSTGSLKMKNPHGGVAKSGVAAQGHLLIAGDVLLVPTGKAVPAAFEKATGKFKYFRLNNFEKLGGGQCYVHDDYFVSNGVVMELKNGLGAGHSDGTFGYFHGDKGFVSSGTALKINTKQTAFLQLNVMSERKKRGRRGKISIVKALKNVWKTEKVSMPITCLIGAGNQIISGSKGKVEIIDIDSQKIISTINVEGTVYNLAITDNKLLISTDKGLIYCYGKSAANAVAHTFTPKAITHSADTIKLAKSLIAKSGLNKGYLLDLGCGDGSLAIEIVKQSNFYVIAVDNNLQNINKAREKCDAAGLLGSRIAFFHVTNLSKTNLPNYFANVSISSNSLLKGEEIAMAEAKRCQKPYNGVLLTGSKNTLSSAIRPGLKGAGSWTHAYANAANTMCSDDDLVKGELTILWYNDILYRLGNRHGRSPPPLFDKGTLIYGGMEGFIAVDAYNGHELWRHAIKDLLKIYDGDSFVGSSVVGSHYCLGDGFLFVKHNNEGLKINLTTGKLVDKYKFPYEKGQWGFFTYSKGQLIGTVGNEKHVMQHNPYAKHSEGLLKQYSEGKKLFVIDTKTKKLTWEFTPKHSIRHNTITIGKKEVYIIDRPIFLKDRHKKFRKGLTVTKDTVHEKGIILAFNRYNGNKLWENKKNIYGTVLSLSEEHETLMMTYMGQKWAPPSEKHYYNRGPHTHLAAFNTKDGKRRWDIKSPYQTHIIINGDTAYSDMHNWKIKTGETTQLKFKRGFGCGLLSASKHLMLWRSGTLAYHNFGKGKGIQYFGGMRPGCWINVIPAGGIVLAPNGSTGCSCSFLNETWFALEPKK